MPLSAHIPQLQPGGVPSTRPPACSVPLAHPPKPLSLAHPPKRLPLHPPARPNHSPASAAPPTCSAPVPHPSTHMQRPSPQHLHPPARPSSADSTGRQPPPDSCSRPGKGRPLSGCRSSGCTAGQKRGAPGSRAARGRWRSWRGVGGGGGGGSVVWGSGNAKGSALMASVKADATLCSARSMPIPLEHWWRSHCIAAPSCIDVGQHVWPWPCLPPHQDPPVLAPNAPEGKVGSLLGCCGAAVAAGRGAAAHTKLNPLYSNSWPWQGQRWGQVGG